MVRLFHQKMRMLFMMLDAGYRDILAKNARKWIASRYEQGFVHKCLYDFYDTCL